MSDQEAALVGRRGRLVMLAVALAIPMFVAVLAGRAVATAQTTSPGGSPAPDQLGSTGDEGGPAPSPGVRSSIDTEQEPEPGPSPTSGLDEEPESDPEAPPTDDPSADVGPSGNDGAGIRPSVRRSRIPVGTIAAAVGVLAIVGLGAFMTSRRAGMQDAPEGSQPQDTGPTTTPSLDGDATVDRDITAFLLELGEALIDAGDSVDRVAGTLHTVAERAGLRELGVIVLPTALIISAPGRENVQTQVSAVGTGRLRLDQIEAVFGIVDLAASGNLEPAVGRAELARVRASSSPVPGGLVLVGHALAAVGLALILRGGVMEVALAGALGAAVAMFQLLQMPRQSNFRPFLPLVASFLIATVVFLVGRIAPGLAILPALAAPLIPFLPGALLTMGTLELATGQSLSGVARLGSGGLQLVLLAAGILGAVQFVGLPGATDVAAATSPTGWGGAAGVLAPWVGVAVFGLGIAWAHAARRSSWRWILGVLFVAYAGQIVGGVFFGNALSAFFGALAMTPVAVHAARQRLGPPSLVTFLPAFWLLVPGALGLEGVARILSDRGVQGVATLVTTGTAMVGIALGILLGLLVVDPDSWRHKRVGRGKSQRR